MNKYLKYRHACFCSSIRSSLYLYTTLAFFAICLIATPAHAQVDGAGKITFVIKRHQTLKSVFQGLETLSSYHLIYDPEVINDKIQPGEQTFTNETITGILKKLGFGFFVNNKSIILNKITIKATSTSVTGKVVDSLEQALPGVSVHVKGDTHGALTDQHGKYVLNVVTNDVLVFSMVGFVSQEKTVAAQSVIDVTLLENRSVLNEVVVVGYGTQKKINLTGAVGSVKMSDLLGNRPVSNTGALMQNVIPGLQVTTTNGQPGASFNFNVRGATDIPPTGSGNVISTQGPLILVDNVPLNGPLNLLNPDDIESVTVLKDAGSAAIYGARSAFGVILVTTKKGNKNQKITFNYSDNFTASTPVNLPQKATVLQTIQSYKDIGTTGYWTGQDVDTWLALAKQYSANAQSYPGGYATVGGIRYQLATTDAFKDLLGKYALQNQHNISASGGSDKITYRISLGTVNENGVIVPSSHQDYYKRYNVKSVVTSDINKWMTIQLDASYDNSLKSYPASTGFSSAAGLAPYTPLTDSLTYNGATTISNTPRNMVLLSSPTTDRLDDTRLTGRTILKPFTGFTLTGEYTFDNLRELITSYDKISTAIDPRSFIVSTAGSGTFKKINALTDYHALNIFGNYTKTVKNHHFSVLAGFNQEDNSFEQVSLQRTTPISNNLPSISQSTGPITGDDNYSEYAIRGFFGRFNYDYKSKYLFEINGRNDASSKFPQNRRSGFFPSVSAGWVVSKEKFMQHAESWLNELKIRGSFGSVGNQNISPYQFVPGLTSYYAYWMNGGQQVTTLNPPDLVSSNFTWSTVQTANAGFDFAMFKNRLTGSFDIYQRDTKNLLYKGIQLPAVLGANAPLQNVAALRSQGWELQVNWRDKIGDFNYHIGANLYDFVSKVTKIQNQAGLLSQYYVGQQLGEIYGYITDRLYTTNDFVPGTLNSNLTGGTLKPGIPKVEGTLPNPGDVLYKDLDGNGIINAGASTLSNLGDRRVIGNNSLRYQFGISGGFGYKNFDFSFVTTGIGKQDQFRTNVLSFPNYYNFGTIYANQLNYWTPTNTNSFYGRTYDQARGNQSFNEYVQTRYMLNGANFRIKNLTLGYAIPARLIHKLHIDRFKVFCSVENAFNFTHFPKGSDPAINPSGTYGYDYPFMRLYSLGVNVSF